MRETWNCVFSDISQSYFCVFVAPCMKVASYLRKIMQFAAGYLYLSVCIAFDRRCVVYRFHPCIFWLHCSCLFQKKSATHVDSSCSLEQRCGEIETSSILCGQLALRCALLTQKCKLGFRLRSTPCLRKLLYEYFAVKATCTDIDPAAMMN